MVLRDFLNDVAKQQGADSLQGAVVFLMLERPLDEIIANALAIGPYHPGKPSPWSHCFLVTEPYRGLDTAILDCTIRDEQGNVAWDTPLKESLEILATGFGKKGAGAIYTAKAGDYDNATKVSAYGVRWLPGLSLDEKKKLVTVGHGLQAEGYKYDLPGLLRQLVRLLTGIVIPPGQKRLFCSSFLQAVYRLALGARGDFNTGLLDADTSPDDIWYSPEGLSVANFHPQSDGHSPTPNAPFGSAAPAPNLP